MSTTPKYSEKFFLRMFEDLKKRGPIPDCCVVGSDLIARDVLTTLDKHNIPMTVICDHERPASSILMGSLDAFAKFKGGCDD